MKGRIVKVEEVKGRDENYGYREIVVIFIGPSKPYRPVEYNPDWKEQQSPISEYNIKEFERYDEEMKEYHKAMDELDSFHVGGVDITQKKVEEVNE